MELARYLVDAVVLEKRSCGRWPGRTASPRAGWPSSWRGAARVHLLLAARDGLASGGIYPRQVFTVGPADAL